MSVDNHYATLGVPSSADAAAIRRAFRVRVREMHPDVAANQAIAHEAFLGVQEAYAVLSDPKRRAAYDLRLANERARSSAEPAAPPQSAPPTFNELLNRADQSLKEGRPRPARVYVVEALKMEPEQPDALLLMARIFAATGNEAKRIALLEAAVERHPGHHGLRVAFNEALAAAAPPEPPRQPIRKDRRQRLRNRAIVIRWGGGALTCAAFGWGVFSRVPAPDVVRAYTDLRGGLIYGGCLAAAVLGFTLASGGVLEPVDDELFYPDTAGRSLGRSRSRPDPPMGLVMPLLALLNYYVALVLLLGISVGRGRLGKSVAAAFLAALALAGFTAALAPAAWRFIFLMCPGWNLAALFFGWFWGDIFRE